MTTRSLDDWLIYISSTHPSSIEMGLDRVRSVYKSMQLRKRSKQTVVVSGTNGKGSTIALIEAGLLSHGCTVGSYTSPHIQFYNERVRINGQPVSDEELISAFEKIELFRGRIPLTYFEFGTLAALEILFSSDFDVVILEVGLGGRLDAVNVVDADLCIITSIGLDHTDWLGDSIDIIGREKAGILRENTLLIAGENLPESVFQQSGFLGCPVKVYRKDFGVERIDGSGRVFLDCVGKEREFFGAGPELRLPNNNVLISFQAISCLLDRLEPRVSFCYETTRKAFEEVIIPGRLERVAFSSVCRSGEVYLDVGHNPHAAVYLESFLKQKVAEGFYIQAVYSSLEDKDVKTVVDILSPVVDCWFVAPLEDERALNLVQLDTIVGRVAKNMLSFSSVFSALDSALLGNNYVESGKDYVDVPKSQAPSMNERLRNNGKVMTLVFGSFFMVEAAKNYFEKL